MKVLRTAVAAILTIGLSGAPAFAGELRESVTAAAATAAAAADAQEAPMRATGGGKALMWGGGALFAGGMTYGLYQFINNKNGTYSEFGEAAATNKKGGAAGLSLAFVGGALMLLGHHSAAMPSVTVGAKTVGLAKKLSW